MDPNKLLIYDLTLAQLREQLKAMGEPDYRALQVWQGLYQQLWDDPEQFTNLPASLRQNLSEQFSFSSLTPSQIQNSKDGETTKTLFLLPDGMPLKLS